MTKEEETTYCFNRLSDAYHGYRDKVTLFQWMFGTDKEHEMRMELFMAIAVCKRRLQTLDNSLEA